MCHPHSRTLKNRTIEMLRERWLERHGVTAPLERPQALEPKGATNSQDKRTGFLRSSLPLKSEKIATRKRDCSKAYLIS